MDSSDLTLEVLRAIRDEVRGTNVRIDATNERLDTTIDTVNARFEETNRRIVESEVRTSTAVNELVGAVHELTHVFVAQGDLRPRVEKCEQDIQRLKAGLPRRSKRTPKRSRS